MSNARIERFLFSGRRGHVRTNPAKADPYKSIFGEYTFIRVRLGGMHPCQPVKGVLRELQTHFADQQDVGLLELLYALFGCAEFVAELNWQWNTKSTILMEFQFCCLDAHGIRP